MARGILIALVAVMLGVAGCEGSGPPAAGHSDSVHAYTVRGEVLEVLEDALVLHHEAIDDFVGSDGRVKGMDSMVMGFHLGPGMRPDVAHEGDKVRFRFEVRPEGRDHVVTEVEKLPADTVLDFRAAHPLADE